MIHMTLDYGIDLLAEFLGWERIRADFLLHRYDACFLAMEWQMRRSEADFYTNSALYLPELIHWNSSAVFRNVHQAALAEVHDCSVLDFGAGIGAITHQLVQQGNVVRYVDTNYACRQFAEWWGRKLNASALHYAASLDEAPLAEPVDVVVAVDVLEHVPDLERCLIALAARLKPGGRIYAAPSFSFEQVYPMHHIENGPLYEGAMVAAGFVHEAGGWWRKGCKCDCAECSCGVPNGS